MEHKKIDFTQVDWNSVLPRFGFEPGHPKKHTECPIEQDGKKRFRFDNRTGRGEWICSNCGNGDGVRLVALLQGCDDGEAIRRIRDDIPEVRNVLPLRREPFEFEPDRQWARQMLAKTWEEGTGLAESVALKYLQMRVPGLKLEWLSTDLRAQANLRHQDSEDEIRFFPSLIAIARDVKGEPVTIHRTYLDASGSGAKAPLPANEIKKMMTGVRKLDGESILLNTASRKSRVIFVCEGIETGLSLVAAYKNRYPVYSAMTAGNMAKFKVAPGLYSTVVIWADNDPINPRTGKPTGIEAAKDLGRALAAVGQKAVIRLPKVLGQDFADVWLARHQQFTQEPNLSAA